MAVDVRLELLSPLGDIEGLAFVETFAWAELPSPLGDLNVLAHVVPLAWAELPSPLGDLKIVAGPIVRRARVALPSPLGALAAVGYVPGAVWLALPSPLGALRIRASAFGDAWGSAGFPLPRIQGYTYQRDAGLTRTKMLSGRTLQRRKWTDAYRQATVSFEIPTSLLYEMEAFIDEQGYDWLGMALVTGDNAAETAEIHQVRISADPSYGDVYGENITVNLTIEIGNKLAGPEEPAEPACIPMDDPGIEVDNGNPGWVVEGCINRLSEYGSVYFTVSPSLFPSVFNTVILTGTDLSVLTDYPDTNVSVYRLDPYELVGQTLTTGLGGSPVTVAVTLPPGYAVLLSVVVTGPSDYAYLDPEEQEFLLCCVDFDYRNGV